MARAQTKGERKRAKRRAREAAEAMESAGVVPDKPKRGRPPKPGVARTPSGAISRAGQYQPTRERQEAVQRVALAARARQTGNQENRTMLDAMKSPMMGCNAGRAISGAPDAAALWDTIQSLRTIRTAYLRALDAPADYASIAKLPVKPNPGDTEAVVSLPPSEPLTDEEAADAAIRRWEAVMDALRVVDPLLIRVIDQVVIHDQPAPAGFPAAIRIVKGVMDG